MAAFSLSPALTACGGGSTADEVRDPKLLTENKALRDRAEAAVADGLVGAVYASQHASTDKLYLGAAGKVSLAGAALKGDEPFQLASMSKSMTAALIAHWVDAGRLRWDSRPADVMPELKGTQHAAYAQVTLAQLLDHRGGVVPVNSVQALDELMAALATHEGPLPDTAVGRRRLVVGFVMMQAPAGRPGQDFVYSNAGYTVAGAMLEASTGLDFDTLMRQWAKPLGLELQLQQPANAPAGHEGPAPARLQRYAGFPAELQPWVDTIKPSGEVWMTPAAYGRWLAEHQRALQAKGHGLPASYARRLRELAPGEYALGWQAGPVNGRASLSHGGADKGFMGDVVLAQDGRSAYFALTNTFGVNPEQSTSWSGDVLHRHLLLAHSR
jgi:CubicO group peptidase (beta-lactamase class C family)